MIAHYLPGLATEYFILEWLIRLAMLFVVPFRRTPQAAQAWLLTIFFLPVPGVILYAAIGRPRFPAWRTARLRSLAPFFAEVSSELDAPRGDAEAGLEQSPVATLARGLGSLPATGGNHVEFLDDYDGTIDRLVADIDTARRHVRILVYIFADDAPGLKLIEALGRASARGVACHVMIDALGSRQWAKRVLKRLRDAGVTARQALPLRLLRGRTRGDMRNHRKLFLIDGAIGYAGSQNIVDKNFKPGIVNHELVVRMTGPAVAEMEAIFLGDWYVESETMLDRVETSFAGDGTTVAQLLPSGADYPLEGFETLLVWQIHQARRRVVITTPYLIPDEGLIGAMRTAVARGVEIDLIVSKVVDQRLVSLAQRSYFQALLEAGIRIHQYRDLLLHAKNVSIDGALGIVGSSNVDLRSFQLNEEVSLLLLDTESVSRLEAIQHGYIDASDLLDLEAWRARPRRLRIIESLARLVSPLL